MNTYKKRVLKNWGLAFEGGGGQFGCDWSLKKIKGFCRDRYSIPLKNCLVLDTECTRSLVHLHILSLTTFLGHTFCLVIWGGRLKLYFTSPRTIHSLSEPVPPHWW